MSMSNFMRSSKMRSLTVLVVVWAFVLGLAVGPQPARALDFGGAIGDLVKIFGIGWVVNKFSDDIDDAINDLLAQREAEIANATKVVPILRVAEGGNNAIGAAQVMGPEAQVKKCSAVAELELSIGELRGRALLPISTKRNVTSSVKGIEGVGVSANIKFPI
ncbi:MAG: hypothetical protein GF393_09590 [Armatimonadia bacterium]|nr:hypothetical protein [Armatimonadia bacterium]